MADDRERRAGKDRRTKQTRKGERRAKQSPVKVDRRSGAQRRTRQRRAGKDRRKS